MKKLVAAFAFATLIASPAFAAKRVITHTASQAYASDVGGAWQNSTDAVFNGMVVGRDPDPSVRLNLIREGTNPTGNTGN